MPNIMPSKREKKWTKFKNEHFNGWGFTQQKNEIEKLKESISILEQSPEESTRELNNARGDLEELQYANNQLARTWGGINEVKNKAVVAVEYIPPAAIIEKISENALSDRNRMYFVRAYIRPKEINPDSWMKLVDKYQNEGDIYNFIEAKEARVLEHKGIQAGIDEISQMMKIESPDRINSDQWNVQLEKCTSLKEAELVKQWYDDPTISFDDHGITEDTPVIDEIKALNTMLPGDADPVVKSRYHGLKPPVLKGARSNNEKSIEKALVKTWLNNLQFDDFYRAVESPRVESTLLDSAVILLEILTIHSGSKEAKKELGSVFNQAKNIGWEGAVKAKLKDLSSKAPPIKNKEALKTLLKARTERPCRKHKDSKAIQKKLAGEVRKIRSNTEQNKSYNSVIKLERNLTRARSGITQGKRQVAFLRSKIWPNKTMVPTPRPGRRGAHSNKR